MEYSTDESGFVFPFEVLTLTEIFKKRKLFKEKEASRIRNKAKTIYSKTTALIKSVKGRA